ncbi:MAG: class I SAM-dependent methyltransferase [Verrucomicrobia bacterium]|nr:class I SAM-dependent methyltransferase [Cytophagales bacterium]
MGLPTDLQAYQEYYQSKEKDSLLGWKNKEAQTIRFEQLTKVINLSEHFSVNDLGCGWGHFADFLESQRLDYAYVGCDILPEMITKAQTRHESNNRCRFEAVGHASQMPIADYVVASGIFNLRFDVSDKEWQQFIIETIDSMHQKSRKGFAFNALTSYSDAERMESQLFYADPCQLFDYCKRNCSKNVALLHDYFQYDFTILVRK